MSKRDIPFYATEGDIIDLCFTVSSMSEIQFSKHELSNDSEIIIFSDPVKLQSHSTYCISYQGSVITNKAIPQRDGGIKYIADQVVNKNAIYIHLGGLSVSNRLLPGQLGTMSENNEAIELDNLFRKIIKNKFTKIKSHYVGPEACKLLDSGVRLSLTNKSPEIYDLKR